VTTASTYSLIPGGTGLLTEESLDDGLPKEPVENLSHCDEAVLRLIAQYEDKPRMHALLCTFVGQIQELEVAIFDLYTERTIDTAVDAQLDALGSIVGQPRLGFVDANYRSFIKARIKINLSSGRPEELIEILRLIADPLEATDIRLTEVPPAGLHLALLSDIGTLDPDIAFTLLRSAKSAGVSFQFIFSTEPALEQFTLDADTTGQLDTALGLGNILDAAVGGKLTDVRST